MTASYSDIILWAIFLFLGYIGYGAAVVRLLNLAEFNDFGWAAKAAVGMSASIVLGSALMVFKAATPVGLTSVAVVGFGLACYFFYVELNKTQISTSNKRKGKGKPPVAKKANYAWLFLVIPGAFALLTFATSVYWPFQYDPNDDWIAYLAFPEKILQTGTLIEPFSQRRITSLCGQSVLLAQIMIFAEPESAHLLDRGLGAILLFGLLVEATRKTAPGWQWLRALIVLAAVTVSVPRINTSSTVIGVCLMFGVLFSTSKVLNTRESDWRAWVLPALILAGASSLRFTYALTCGGALAVCFFWKAITSPRREWFQQVLPLFKTGIITLAFLSPLMIVSWESSKTPFYPLFNGNLMTDAQHVKTGRGFFEDLRITVNYILMPEMFIMCLGLLSSFFLNVRNRQLAISMVLISLLLIFLVGFNTTGIASSWNLDFYRLSFPLAAVTFFWILAMHLEIDDCDHRIGKSTLVGVLVAIFWLFQLEPAIKEIQAELEIMHPQQEDFKFQTAALKPFYEDLQKRVPEGEKILAVLDAYYLLNFERNPISSVDNIGCASPSPGMPFNHGPEALREYLVHLGYKYLIAVDFNSAVFLYNRKVMENHPRPEYRDISKKYYVDFMNNIDLISSRSIVYRNLNARLILLTNTQNGI